MFVFPVVQPLPIPQHSISLSRAAADNYLELPSATLGTFSTSTFAVSFWVQRGTLGGTGDGAFIGKGVDSSSSHFRIGFNSSNKLFVQTTKSSALDGEFISTTTFNSSSTWYKFLIHFDLTNGTASNRLKVWYGLTAETADGSSTNPTGAADSNSSNVFLGRDLDTTDGQCLLYQTALFTGVLPPVGKTITSIGTPKEVRRIVGIASLVDGTTGVPEYDRVLNTNWTETGNVIFNGDIPG